MSDSPNGSGGRVRRRLPTLSTPRHRKVLAYLVVVVAMLAGLLPAAAAIPVYADGGDISIDFAAPRATTYNHATGGGAYNGGGSASVVESLQGGDFACRDTVTYFTAITVRTNPVDARQTAEITLDFSANSTGQPGAGHGDVTNVVVNYGMVENGGGGGRGTFGPDTGMQDDGGSTATVVSEAFLPAGSTLFNGAQNLRLVFRVDDLEAGEQVIVRIDTTIACNPGSDPTGNLQASVVGARVVDPVNSTISAGAQTINFQQIGNIAGTGEPLLVVEKTVTTPDGACPGVESLTVVAGDSVKYCYTLSNPGTHTLYDVTLTDDNGTPGNTADDFPVTLTGLTNIDGQADAHDLASGATAYGEAVRPLTTASTVVNTARGQGNNGRSGGNYRLLTDTDTATVVVQASGRLDVTKTVNWNGVPQYGATFEICITGPSYPTTPNCQTVGVNGGMVSWPNLRPGTYSVSENSPGSAWTVSITPQQVQVAPAATATVSISNTHEPGGSLTVTKLVNWNGFPADPAAFFTICIERQGAPVLPESCVDIYPDGQGAYSYTWNNLLAGTYTVTEQGHDSSVWTVSGSGQSVAVASGGSASAQLSNTHVAAGRIIVVKTTDPEGSTQLFDFTASYDEDGFSLSHGGSNDSGPLMPGVYSVLEEQVLGWRNMRAACDDESPITAIDVSAGETVICTFANMQFGSLAVNKQWFSNGEQTDAPATPATVCLTRADGLPPDAPEVNGAPLTPVGDAYCYESLTGPITITNLWPGHYTVVETSPAGWQSSTADNTTVTVGAGQAAGPLTFRNDQLGSAKAVKYEDLNGNGARDDGESALSGWTMTLSQGGIAIATNASGEALFGNLLPGEYEVCETMQEGWLNSSDLCQGVTVRSAQEAVVSFGNLRLGSLPVGKTWYSNGQPVAAPATPATVCVERAGGWPANSSAPQVNGVDMVWGAGAFCYDNLTGSITVTGLWPGSYSVTETSPAGWTGSPAGATVAVGSGHTADAVAFRNDENLGSLTVTKTVDWANVTPDQSKTFEICIDSDLLAEPLCQTVDFGGGSVTFENLRPGQYTVTESDPGEVWTVSGSGETVQVRANATAQAQISNVHEGEGSVTVTKAVEWNGATPDGTLFRICLSGPSFSQPDCQNLAAGGSYTWSHLRPGNYSVTEENPGAHWGTPQGTGPVAVSASNTPAAVTVTNTYVAPGSITVTKSVNWNGFPGSAGQTFEICLFRGDTEIGCEELAHGESFTWDNLPHGVYTVREDGVDTAIWSVGGTGDVTLAAGGAQSVTVTNTHVAPGTIRATKTVDWNGFVSDETPTFTLCLNGSQCQTVSHGQYAEWTNLLPGTYTVSEPGVDTAIWTVSGGGSVTVAAGQTAATTVTNTHVAPGVVRATKQIEWSGFPAHDVSFELCLSGEGYGPECRTVTADDQTVEWGNLLPGTYTLSESDAGGNWAVQISATEFIFVSGGVQEATVTNTHVAPGTIRATKRVEWNGYVSDETPVFTLCLNGGQCQTVSHGQEAVWTNLLPSTYTVSEPGVDTTIWTVSGAPVEVTLAAGGSEVREVVNTHAAPGSISVTKQVNWNGAQPADGTTFSICITGRSYPDGNCQTVGANGGVASWSNLLPGNYTVSEGDLGAEWIVEIDDATVELAAGGTGTATVTNTYVSPGSLIVTKVVNWNGAEPDAAASFTICITGPSYAEGAEGSCQTVTGSGGQLLWENLLPGDYLVVEQGVDMGVWTQIEGNNATVRVNADGGAGHTVTNTHAGRGSLTITKQVVWNGAEVIPGISFDICITGPSFPQGDCQTVVDGGAAHWPYLLPGDYTISERDLGAEWTASATANPAQVAVNQNTAVTLTNTHAGRGSLTVHKLVDWNNVPVDESLQFEICISGPSFPAPLRDCQYAPATGGDVTWPYLLPGDYTVTETHPGVVWTVEGSGQIVQVGVNGGHEATVRNVHEGRGRLEVTKSVNWNQFPPIQGQTFEICISGPSYPDTANCQTIGEGQTAVWADLRPGQYTISEPNLGEQWLPVQDQTVTVAANATTQTGVTNTHEGRGSLRITKLVNWNDVPTDTNKTFEICLISEPLGYPLTCQTVDWDGGELVWTDLRPGEYIVSETNPGVEWTVEINPQIVQVIANQEALVTVDNRHEAGGSLTVVKTVDWNGFPEDQAATFRVCINRQGEPQLPESCVDLTYENGYSYTWTNLLAGDYILTENVDETVWSVEGNGQTVAVTSGGTANAALTNTHIAPATVQATKRVDWNGFPAYEVSFELCLSSESYGRTCQTVTADGVATWENLFPGTYTLEESDPGSLWSVSGAPLEIVVESGGLYTFDVTNTHVAPGAVQATKRVVWNGAPAQEVSFELCLSGEGYERSCQTVAADGVATWSNLLPGVYTVTESDPGPVWSVSGAPAEVVVVAGQTAAIEVTNSYVAPGHIIVKKVTDPAGAPDEFRFTASYSEAGFSLRDGQSHDSGPLAAGVYSVSELAQPGWRNVSAICSDGSPAGAIQLAAGETVTCTFKNVKEKPGLEIKKYTNGEDADSAPGPKIKIGGKVAWQYVVRNTGQEVLINITVTDDKEGVICTIARLAPGEFAKCVKTGKAVNGQYANVGTATGQTETGAPVSDSDPSHYMGLPSIIGTGSGVIGDRVWLDKNDNGIQDANEQTGVANVTVRLYTAAGELVAETKTDANGKYLFEGLPEGSYFLLFSQPKGYSITPKNRGSDIGLDSDVDPVTRKTAVIELADGETDLNWDMGLSRTSTDIPPVTEPSQQVKLFMPAINR